jgi:calcineurin-like phosphoesterase family protein
MNNIFFTSDWHLDHGRIITYCRRLDFMNDFERKTFLENEAQVKDGKMSREDLRKIRYSQETIDRMNSSIIDGINAVAGPNDIIQMLGDVGFFRSVERFRQLMDRIVCRNIHLIFGNHDRDIREWSRTGQIDGVFKSVQDEVTIRWQQNKIFAHHTACLVWEGSGRKVWHVYGHSHANLEHWREKYLPNAKMIDVGVDYRARLGKGYTMWSFPELKQYMDSKSGQLVDHHGGE